MPTVSIRHTSPVSASFRAAKVQGMFDVPRERQQTVTIDADLPIEDQPWAVGAIVGASGSGKSSIARKVWPAAVHTAGSHVWTGDCVLDDFPEHMAPAEITSLLTAVGFSSPPAWLRPYAVLSTGQQFRADLARSLALAAPQGVGPGAVDPGVQGEPGPDDADHGVEPTVFDEFTSTVDRTVAKAVCVAAAKHVRRAGSRFVAVTCHKDILSWLAPDWYFDTDTGEFTWGCLQRPGIRLRVREGSRQAWRLFRGHHYLTAELSNSCRVFLAYVELDGDERLAGFFSLLPVAGHRGWWRGHRTVVLPDMQGLGIGNRMIEHVAEELWTRERKRFRATTSAPGIVAHRRRHPQMWRLASGPGMKAPTGRTSTLSRRPAKTSAGRLTTTWVYLPTELRA